MADTKKILIVDDDETLRIMLEKYLLKIGYEVKSVDSAINGAELLRKESFSVVITDINMPEVSGLDFLLWIKKHNIDTHVVIMTAMATKEIEMFAQRKGAVNFLKKPFDLKEVSSTLESLLSEKTFSGKINEITLFDFVQLIVLSNKEKRISVFSTKLNKTGYIYIKNGNIIHAEIGSATGEEAFYQIMQIKSGSFEDNDWIEPEKQSINLPNNYLLMEAAKKIDDTASVTDDEENNYKPANRKILVVDDDPMTTKIIEAFFAKKDFQVTTAESAVKGAEILRQEHFGIVLTDLHMPGINGLEFLLWIKTNAPKTHVIIMTSEKSADVKNFASQSGAINYFEKPLNLKDIENFMNNLFKDKSFSGNIKDINLFDFIQIMAMTRKSRLINVFDPITTKMGTIYMHQGNVIHADFMGEYGENAFFSIIQIEKGIFSDAEWMEPPVKTITVPLSSLLMKSMRMLDEKKNEEKQKVAIKNSLLTIPDKNSPIKAEAKFLERILAKKNMIEKIKAETDPLKKLTIYEFGVALEIAIGRSDKKYVIETMKKYSRSDVSLQLRNNTLKYDDISVSIMFGERNIVEEISFGANYVGATNCGVRIGDPLDKALKTYGKPQLSTMRGCVWENIAFFVDAFNIIETIRLRTVEI